MVRIEGLTPKAALFFPSLGFQRALEVIEGT